MAAGQGPEAGHPLAEGQAHAHSDVAGKLVTITIRSSVANVFARIKDQMRLYISTIGFDWAIATIGTANLLFSVVHYFSYDERRAVAWTPASQHGASHPEFSHAITTESL